MSMVGPSSGKCRRIKIEIVIKSHTKSSTSHIGAEMMTAPGLCVSVDQMESPIPGLVAHMKGLPTKCRYSAATVFVDHYSQMRYRSEERRVGKEC